MSDNSGTTIVTGAGSGIGLALVKALVAQNLSVVALDRNVDELVGIRSASLHITEGDVRDRSTCLKLASAAEQIGPISGLICCAAVFRTVPFLELDDNTLAQTLDVNAKGAMLMCQAVLPFLRQRRRGSIVLFSSGFARTGGIHSAHYAASKGAILGLGRSLALEIGDENVRVNILSPGITDTPQPRGNMSEEQMLSRASMIPLGRIGQTDDMVEAVKFLLSEDSSFITGQDLRVNGGAHLF